MVAPADSRLRAALLKLANGVRCIRIGREKRFMAGAKGHGKRRLQGDHSGAKLEGQEKNKDRKMLIFISPVEMQVYVWGA